MDEQGFTDWAVGRQRQLLRSAYLLTGDLHRAEDLVQEALTKVALRWSRLADGNPTAYALRIIARDNISWWRRRRDVPTESVHDTWTSDEPEVALVVRRALARLTPSQRAVLVLRHLEDLTERDPRASAGLEPRACRAWRSRDPRRNRHPFRADGARQYRR